MPCNKYGYFWEHARCRLAHSTVSMRLLSKLLSGNNLWTIIVIPFCTTRLGQTFSSRTGANFLFKCTIKSLSLNLFSTQRAVSCVKKRKKRPCILQQRIRSSLHHTISILYHSISFLGVPVADMKTKIAQLSIVLA